MLTSCVFPIWATLLFKYVFIMKNLSFSLDKIHLELIQSDDYKLEEFK